MEELRCDVTQAISSAVPLLNGGNKLLNQEYWVKFPVIQAYVSSPILGSDC